MINITTYKVALVKEYTRRYDIFSKDNAITDPEIANDLIRQVFELHTLAEEKLVMLTLDVKNKVNGAFTVSHGTVDSSIVSPRDIFKRAMLLNSSGIIIAHNHPSGDSTPSNEDWLANKRLVEAGKLLGIPVVDHLIIPFGDGHEFLSLRTENGNAF